MAAPSLTTLLLGRNRQSHTSKKEENAMWKPCMYVLACALMVWACDMAVASPAPELPLPNEAEYTAGVNAWLEQQNAGRAADQLRWQRTVAGVSSALVLGFLVFVWHTWRLRKPLAFRISRLLLWTPGFLLAGAWFLSPLLLAATALAPVILGIWWKRVLSWWELGVGTVLCLAMLAGVWAVFSVLGGLGAGL